VITAVKKGWRVEGEMDRGGYGGKEEMKEGNKDGREYQREGKERRGEKEGGRGGGEEDWCVVPLTKCLTDC
jgi:hypothetical protein